MRKYVYSTEACCIYNFKSGNREWNGTELRLNWETTQKKTAHTQTHTRIFQIKHWNEREWRLKSTCAGHDVEHTHFSAIKMVSVCHIQAVNKRKMIIVTMNEVRRGEGGWDMKWHENTQSHTYITHQLFAWCQHLILIGQLAIGQKLSFTEPNGPNENKKNYVEKHGKSVVHIKLQPTPEEIIKRVWMKCGIRFV